MASCSSSQEEYEYEGSASQEEYESSSSQEQYEYEGSASQEEDESSSSQEEHEYEGSASHEEYESSSSQEQYEYEGSASQEEDESSSSQEEHEYEGSASHEEYESSSSQEEHEYEGSASQEEYESSSSQEEYEYESYSSQEEYEYERTSSQKEYKYESSSSHEEYEFEVFLSFRGKDTRRGFTGHLYDALHKKNIRTFMDDKKAETGYKISPQLRKAMMGSKIWIIVFSKDFASSRWCLDEVRQILECNRNRNGEIKGNVIPIFYGIKPTVVRQQEESYAVAFAKHAECFKDRIEMVQQWRDALDEVCDVAGHDSENFRYDHELIDKIVNDVLLKLPKDQLTIDHFKKNLIGIEERVKDIESLLCIDSKDDARIIGIWGMGGIESRLYGRRCLSMHDLLREVGQAIVCDESKIPGNRSRLWTATDICHILENNKVSANILEKNKGTDAIQGILLNLSDRGIKKNVQVSPTAFLHMCHLRYLEIYEGETQYDGEFGPGYLQDPYNIYASEGLFDISEELRYLRWDSCPLKYLPNFSPKNLVGLIMHGSKIEKLWNEVQLLDLEKLKKIDLSYSKQLTRIPNLSGAINLEIISLRGCINLVQIHLNLQSLRKLQILDLSHCYNLKECGSSESQEMLSSIPVGLDFSYCTGLRSRSILWNEVQGACPFVDVVYPGGEIPKWFNNVSTDDGNTINFQLPLNWFKFTNSPYPFVVCIVGVLNNFDDDDHDKRMRNVSLKYNINFKTNTSDGRLHKYIDGHATTSLLANTHNADYVFIMHDQYMHLDGRVLGQLIGPHWCFNRRNVDSLQASFSICLMEGVGVNLDIKKCGIHFLYDYDEPNVDSTRCECSDQASGYQNNIYMIDQSPPQISSKRIKLMGQDICLPNEWAP
nr:probable WRKY transcription factor 19 isoform X4 [Ziziphus jujuba var. spinosa]